MSKKNIKDSIIKVRGDRCELSGELLPEDASLFDVHRKTHRADGGRYTDENTIIATPRAHMEEHGILRVRTPWGETLKDLMDARSQTMKLAQKISNQFLAIKRGVDTMDPDTEAMLRAALEPVKARLAVVDKSIAKHLKNAPDPLVTVLMSVRGIGPVTAAGVINYIDLEKADSPSALWKYCGYHAASHARYNKGEAGGGNKTLRTIFFNWAENVFKDVDHPYNPIYRETKERLANSDKLTNSYNTQGKLVQCAWKDAMPKHRHMAAMRTAIKHFLADYWMVGREVKGLSTRTLYVEQHLGHDGIIKPESRGWNRELIDLAVKINSLL